MLNLSNRRIFLARAVVDMRKSFDTLADVVRLQFRMDPLNGDVFVFVGKNRRRVKMLLWERSGFWLCSKRLENGLFAVPDGAAQPAKSFGSMSLTLADMQALLDGIVSSTERRLPQYQRANHAADITPLPQRA